MMAGVIAATYVPPVLSTFDAVRIDNRTTQHRLYKTATTADSSLLTVSLWFKISYDSGSQYSLVQLDEFNSYIFVKAFATRDIMVALIDTAFSKYFQFGTAGNAFNDNVWNHLYIGADANHAAGGKLKFLLVNAVDKISAGVTQDADAAFNIGLSGKNFGIPSANGMGLISSWISYAHVWIKRGTFLSAADVTKFRSVGGEPVDLGTTGQIPTGSSPDYYFTGNSTTFASNLGTGGTVTLTGSLEDVTGPP